jgi:hypothetical protein
MTKKPNTRPTTSSRSKSKKAQDDGALLAPENKVQSSPSTNHDKGTTTMVDENQVEDTIIEYSEDISDAEPPVPLPPGTYTASIRASEKRLNAKQTGYYAATTIFISPDEYPADYVDGNPDGTSIIYRRVSVEDSPMARFGMRTFCETVGAKMGKQIDLNNFVGLECRVEITNEMWEGFPRHQINKVLAP